MLELKLSDAATKQELKKIMYVIEAFGGEIADPNDAEQIYAPLDQVYIDYILNNQIVTLHYEHYSGIFILSETATQADLENIKYAYLHTT